MSAVSVRADIQRQQTNSFGSVTSLAKFAWENTFFCVTLPRSHRTTTHTLSNTVAVWLSDPSDRPVVEFLSMVSALEVRRMLFVVYHLSRSHFFKFTVLLY